jgi:hypothetical protein
MKKTGAGSQVFVPSLITIQTKHSTLAIENPFADGHHALSQEVLKALDKYGKLQEHPYGPYKEAAAYPVLDVVTASADLVGFLDIHLKVGDQAFKPFCCFSPWPRSPFFLERTHSPNNN